jgi:hypothetical protein
VKNHRRTALIAAAGVLILGGVAVGAGAAVAANAGIVRQCDTAQRKLATADNGARKATAAAVAAVTASESTKLPNTEGWTSTPYADKQASTAAPKGSSGKDRLTAVAEQRKKLRSLTTAPHCESRDDAHTVTAAATAVTRTTAQLTAAVTELENDFASFQSDETTRITVEKAAAKRAADEAAAKAAAEAAAAKAAADEAARQAAASPTTTSGATSSRTVTPPTGGAPAAGGSAPSSGSGRVTAPWGGTAPRKGPDFVGGGSVGSGSSGGCVADNGHGGTMHC